MHSNGNFSSFVLLCVQGGPNALVDLYIISACILARCQTSNLPSRQNLLPDLAD